MLMVLTVALIILTITIIIIAFQMHFLAKQVTWLQDRFYIRAIKDWEFNLPNEILEISRLANVIKHFPLVKEASGPIYNDCRANVNFKEARMRLCRLELKEMEEFSKTASPNDNFPASNSLQYETKRFAETALYLDRTYECLEILTNTIADWMTGKVTLTEAREIIGEADRRGKSTRLDDHEVASRYNDLAKTWQAGNWTKNLEELRTGNWKTIDL